MNSGVYTFAFTSLGEMLVGTSDAVYRRQIDSSWVHSSKGIIETRVKVLKFLSNGYLLAGTFYDGLYVTSDGGQNWENLNFPVRSSIEAIAEIPGGELAVGIIGNPGLYLSADAQSKWMRSGLQNIGSLTLGLNNTIFAGVIGRISPRIYRSMDLGSSWVRTGLEGEEINELATDVLGTIYAGTLGNGVFRSEDNGDSWSQIGLQGEIVRALTTSAGTLVFAGTTDGDIFRSEDRGDTWKHEHIAGSNVSDIIVLSDGLIFAGTGSGVFRSMDNGLTWHDFSEGLPEDMYEVSLAHDEMGYLYVGTRSDGVFRSVESVTTSTRDNRGETPSQFALKQNYPNPFNGLTTISFDLRRTTTTRLTIYDGFGREIAILASGTYSSGHHTVVWDAEHFSSGVYVYRLQAGDYWETKRMLLLK